LLKEWEKEYKITDDMVFLAYESGRNCTRERSKIANREIVKKGLTIEQN
jgi:hypothetical protein